MKELFEKPLRLSRPIPGLPYTLQTNGSNVGMGTVFFQTNTDCTRSIISYASANFSRNQTRYKKNDRECLTIIGALNNFTAHLQGHPFTLRTDDETVTSLHSLKETRGKLRQWACQLGTHIFTVEKCLTSRSLLPVALAGTPDGPNDEEDTFVDERLLPPEKNLEIQPPTVSYCYKNDKSVG